MTNYKSLATSVAVVLGMSVAPLSYAAGNGWYIGASVGQSEFDLGSGAELDALLLTDGITSTTTTDDSDTGWKLFGGFAFSENFAVEAGYVDFGESEFNTTVTAPAIAAGVYNTAVETTSFYVDLVGTVPVTDSFNVFGKVGFNRWDVEGTISVPGFGSGTILEDDGNDVTYGVGASYSFTDSVAVRGEWERFDIDGEDMDLLSLGIQYSF